MLQFAALALFGLLHPMDGPDVDLWIEVEDDVVRIHLAPNLAYLDATVETARENPDFVHPIEEPGLRDSVFEYWKDELVVVIDGIRVDPRDAGFRVFEADPALLPMFPRMGRRALTRVQHELEYPAKQPPSRIEWTWPEFPDDPQNPRLSSSDLGAGYEPLEINGRLIALERESLLQFSQRDPRFVWVREEAERGAEALPVPDPSPVEPRFPVGSLVAFLAGALTALVVARKSPLAAGALLVASGGVAFALRPGEAPAAFRVPDEAAALNVFRPLHANLYRAFDYTSEDAIYDALERSAEGPFLDELYQEVYESLELAEEGGARSFVRSVDPLETAITGAGLFPPDDAPGFEVDARWQVEGQVFHWGHSHTRTNVYRARYIVVATPAGWRLRASEVLEHERRRDPNDTDDLAPSGLAAPSRPVLLPYDDL